MLALLQEEPAQASTPKPAASLSCLGETLTKQQICDLDLDALQRLWEVSPSLFVTSCSLQGLVWRGLIGCRQEGFPALQFHGRTSHVGKPQKALARNTIPQAQSAHHKT